MLFEESEVGLFEGGESEEVKEEEEEAELCPSRDEPHARPVTTAAHSGAVVLPAVPPAS